jgi:Tfp pilus assembly protein PilX
MRIMGTTPKDSRGFTLIAALLITVLLSGIAVGLMFMVSNEVRMSGNDLSGNMSYYAAEAGIENLTSQLSQLYQTSQTPSAAALCALVTSGTEINPTQVSGSNISNVTYVENMTWPNAAGVLTCPTTNPTSTWDIVGSGQDQGMVASMIPLTLQVTATMNGGTAQVSTSSTAAATNASVNLTRTIEIALLPAFEFGIFCEYDCDYFAGPPFNFGGRVHTNNNLFLAANSGPLTFTDKITAYGQIVTSQLENGNLTSSGNYGGNVYVPSAAGGCPNAPGSGPATNCTALPAGSWTGGFPPTGSANSAWPGISKSTFGGYIENGLTGATQLELPFVNAGNKVGSIDILRRPTPGDSTLLAQSRFYNEATIHILLADSEYDLYPGEVRSDSTTEDIEIGTPFTGNSVTSGYVAVTKFAPGVTFATPDEYYAVANKGSGSNNWSTNVPTGCNSSLTSWPLHGHVTTTNGTTACTGAWLRVEYWNGSAWTGVTREWLTYGFGRGYDAVPTHPYNASTATAPLCVNFNHYSGTYSTSAYCQNGISPAILILQQLQSNVATSSAMGASTTATKWLPINMYDAREGEPRNSRPSGDPGTDCSPIGIMNVVELDVGNLWLWLQASGPYSAGTGKNVPITNRYGDNENGYILYFSDHRGMITDPYPLTTFANGFSGMSGLNDVVNSSSSLGVPDQTLEPMKYYLTASPTPYSPEDPAIKGAAVNGGNVERWGEANLGAGFGLTGAADNAEPYYIYGAVTSNAVQCISYNASGTPLSGTSTAEWNMVSGPRHGLRLVDAGMDSSGNSFVPPTGGSTTVNGSGFTVASEEPVYVLGNYNTGSADPFWPSENTLTTPHSAAAILADTVTLLSNPPYNSNHNGWTDWESFASPADAGSRPDNTGYYRMAIAAGKTVPFPMPGWALTASPSVPDFGTDGGMHNFLRYLEGRTTVNYAGSMISMYYSQYNTGVYKCCTAVYGAPNRNYFFDTLFENPTNLPPGTPMFQDVVSLGYHQNFTPQ